MMAAGTVTQAMGQKQAAKQQAAMLKYRSVLGERDAAIKAR